MSTQVETLTYTGILTELGGPELAASGKNEKPRKVVIKADPSAQYGKTFRTWHNSFEWNDLEEIGVGKLVTVEYHIKERTDKDGNPLYTKDGDKLKPSNEILSVRSEEAPATSENGEGGGEGNGSSDAWGSVSTAPEPATPPAAWGETKEKLATPTKPETDDFTLRVETSWAIKVAVQLLGPGASEAAVEAAGNRLLALRDKMVEERRA